MWRWWGIHHPKHRRALQALTGPSEATIASNYDDAEGTACGTHYGIGVANKVLACGTRLRICFQRRCEVAIVQDRGPYVAGRELDLNAGAKEAIGCSDLCLVRFAVIR